MRGVNLPSLRGLVSVSHSLRILTAQAISQVEVAAKRSSTGYSTGAATLQTFLTAARNAVDLADRAASIAILPTTATVSTTDRRRTPTSVIATGILGNAQTVFARSTATVTLSANPANGNTVTIAGVTYTFQTVLTNVAGNVLIGVDTTATIANLVAAINLGAGSGTTYAAATTHPANFYGSASTNVATLVLWGVNPANGSAYALTNVGANIAVTSTFSTGTFDSRCTFASGTPAAATVGSYGEVAWVATGSSVVTASFHGRTATLTITAA